MKIAFVSSQGGHLGQIKLVFTKEVVGNNEAILVTESEKITHFFKEKSFNKKFRTYFFPKDKLGLNPWMYLKTFFRLRALFLREKINLVITNGAQISIPATLAAKSQNIPVMFIDTIVRVKTPNWSARACYIFADVFLVQHQTMILKYGKKAQYWGSIL